MASRQEQFVTRIYTAARNIGLAEPQARLAASQAALETAYGKSVKGNNYFGIKAGSSWKGAKQSFKTWEEEGGKRVNIKDTFRKYDSPEESLKDWKRLMEDKYPAVINAKTFDEAKAGLRYGKKGGYATDSKYGSKLAYIERKFVPDADTVEQQPVDAMLASYAPVPQSRPELPQGLLAPIANIPDDVTPRTIPVNDAMNPLLGSMQGASRLTQRNADDVNLGLLSNEYERMRDNYRMLTGEDIPPINDAIAKAGTSRERNTPNSEHFAGKALDFGMRGQDDFNRAAAVEAGMLGGMTGFGFGKNILHADTGPQRGWSYGNSEYAGVPVSEWDRAVTRGELPDNLRVREARGAPIPQQRPESPMPETMMAQASKFDRGGLLNPDQAGSISLVNEAQALPMPVENQQRDYADLTSQTPANGYIKSNQALADMSQMSQTLGGQDTSNDQQAIDAINQQAGLLSLPSSAPLIYPEIALNPESYASDDEYQQALAEQGQTAPQAGLLAPQPQALAQPMPQAAVPQVPFPAIAQPAFKTPPIQQPVMQPKVKDAFGIESASRPFPQNSGLDVWQGRAPTGVASDGSTLSRAANGDVYRYNPKYDHTQIVRGDQTFAPMEGRVEPPKDGQGGFGFQNPFGQLGGNKGLRGAAGAMAGGILGNALGGPIGGLLASKIGQNLAQGRGLLGRRQEPIITQARNAINAPFMSLVDPSLAFPNAPTGEGGGGNYGFRDEAQRERAKGISPSVTDAIDRGQGGLY